MKRFFVFLLIFLIVSCAKARKESDMIENKVFMETSINNDMEDFTYQNISKQKLQDLFDLLLLQKKHPEFNTDIANQLNEISEDNIVVSDKIDTLSIKNISVKERLQQLSDSVQTMKIDFDVHSNLGITKDSLLVIIKTKSIILDDQEFESKKLTFKKLD